VQRGAARPRAGLKVWPLGPITRATMHEEDRELRDLMLERKALEFLLAHACETLLFYADRCNYNAADDGMEEAAMDALVFIAGADAASVRG
jgi:hypothetical protein